MEKKFNLRYTELLAYKKAFELAVDIFEVSKSFPKEERYSLTDQIRRASRSVCANIAEGYRKRRYPKHFISKLSDSDAENAEVQVWTQFAYRFGYIPVGQHDTWLENSVEVGSLLGYMMDNPGKFK
jgi:four helix bundle protein|nr:four helix bundle protein [Phaeodactylibacter xiamenensis]